MKFFTGYQVLFYILAENQILTKTLNYKKISWPGLVGKKINEPFLRRFVSGSAAWSYIFSEPSRFRRISLRLQENAFRKGSLNDKGWGLYLIFWMNHGVFSCLSFLVVPFLKFSLVNDSCVSSQKINVLQNFQLLIS